MGNSGRWSGPGHKPAVNKMTIMTLDLSSNKCYQTVINNWIDYLLSWQNCVLTNKFKNRKVLLFLWRVKGYTSKVCCPKCINTTPHVRSCIAGVQCCCLYLVSNVVVYNWCQCCLLYSWDIHSIQHHYLFSIIVYLFRK